MTAPRASPSGRASYSGIGPSARVELERSGLVHGMLLQSPADVIEGGAQLGDERGARLVRARRRQHPSDERAPDYHAVGRASQPPPPAPGVEIPTPRSTGRRWSPCSAGPSRPPASARVARSPVTPSSDTPYKKPRDRSQIARRRVVGRRGRGEEHGFDAGGVGGIAPTVELVERQVGDDRAVDAGVGELGGEPLGTRVRRRGCNTSSRRAGCSRRARAASATIFAGVAPSSSARCDASWIVRPSMTGSENGMPISMASAPASATARTTSSQAEPRPPVTYGTSSVRPGVAPLAQLRLELHRELLAGERSATCAASLSPRPDSVTSTVEPAGTDRPASRASHAIACAGSSAGTMPSMTGRGAGSRRPLRRRSRTRTRRARSRRAARARARRPGSRARR